MEEHQMKNELSNLLESCVCPISFEIFRDPVITADGHTYERDEIESWLKSNNTSPKTGLTLKNKNLIPNYTVKSIISDLAKYENTLIEKLEKLAKLEKIEKSLSKKILKDEVRIRTLKRMSQGSKMLQANRPTRLESLVSGPRELEVSSEVTPSISISSIQSSFIPNTQFYPGFRSAGFDIERASTGVIFDSTHMNARCNSVPLTLYSSSSFSRGSTSLNWKFLITGSDQWCVGVMSEKKMNRGANLVLESKVGFKASSVYFGSIPFAVMHNKRVLVSLTEQALEVNIEGCPEVYLLPMIESLPARLALYCFPGVNIQLLQ